MSQSLIFFGSDQYSRIALDTIIQGNPDLVISVVTDKQSGGSPVEKLAKNHDLPITYYPAIPDITGAIGLCASFDHLIPKDVISQFDGNLYNLHPSLLPQYRNVSPVQYAIAMGDKETGITLFRISPGIDDGEIIAQVSEPILESDSTPTLTTRLFARGADLFLRLLRSDLVGYNPDQKPTRSDLVGVPLIFTHRLTRDSGYIEWPVLEQLLANKHISPTDTKNELLALRLTHNHTGAILADLLRALTPWPGIWSLVPTKKGELRVSLESVIPDITLKLAGKPKPISLSDFKLYYLP